MFFFSTSLSDVSSKFSGLIDGLYQLVALKCSETAVSVNILP
jgi:hypothetical protein